MKNFAATLRASTREATVSRLQCVLDAGFLRLVVEPPLYEAWWQELRPWLPKDSVLALRLFAPYPKEIKPGRTAPLFLGQLGSEAKRDAAIFGEATLRTASELGAPWVLLPTAPLDLRPSGQPRHPEIARQNLRKELAPRALDSYLSTVSQLLEQADRFDVSFGISASDHLDELPNEEELEIVLNEFTGARLSLWPDANRWAKPPLGETTTWNGSIVSTTQASEVYESILKNSSSVVFDAVDRGSPVDTATEELAQGLEWLREVTGEKRNPDDDGTTSLLGL